MPYYLSSLFLSGLLESSTRLKPHEAQNYRKKALWVSWFSIIVTLALAVAAFSEYQEVSPINTHSCLSFPLTPVGCALLSVDCYWWVKIFFRWLDNQGTHELLKWLHSSAEGRGMRKERRGITESFDAGLWKWILAGTSRTVKIVSWQMPSARADMTNTHPGDLDFESNATRWVQYCRKLSPFPLDWGSCKVRNEIMCTILMKEKWKGLLSGF